MDDTSQNDFLELAGLRSRTHDIAERALDRRENGPDAELSPAQTAHVADVFRTKVRDAVKKQPKTSTIHLFIAGPTGLAFLFGRNSNTLRPIQTYLYSKDEGQYYPVGRLQNQPLSDRSDAASEEQ